MSERTTVVQGDSVPFLHRLAAERATGGDAIDLLYLDSFDYDFANPYPSAVHHLKELCAIAPALRAGTLVMVDDAFHLVAVYRTPDGQYHGVHDPGIGGKALFVAQYFQQIGVPLLFEGYQCGWVMP